MRRRICVIGEGSGRGRCDRAYFFRCVRIKVADDGRDGDTGASKGCVREGARGRTLRASIEYGVSEGYTLREVGEDEHGDRARQDKRRERVRRACVEDI